MLHQRLLDALDASSPLLLVEAFPGSGTLTALRQWEERGGHRDGELRMLVDARRLPLEIRPLMTLLWNTLRHRISHDLPDLLEEEGEETMRLAALHDLTRIRRPMTLAIHHADQLHAENLSVLLYVLEAGARLVVAGSDLSHLLEEVRGRGLYYSRLVDGDVRLNRFETGMLLAERGVELGEAALTSLHRATLGHPGMVLASLESMPIDVENGLLTRDRALAAFLAKRPLEQRDSRFARFLCRAVHLPRFTAAEARELGAGGDALTDLQRLQDLGFGAMTWHTGVGKRVFRWRESTRQTLLRACPESTHLVAETSRRLVSAAERDGDEELLLSMMLAAGRLEEAEALLGEKIWDLLPNAMAPLWSPLMRRSPLELVEHPALLAARLRIGPHRTRSPVSLRAALSAQAQHRRRGEQISPWARCGELARELHLALYAGDREGMIDLYTRARALIEDLVGSDAIEDAGGREVSELMFLADTVFRSGNTIPAAEIARFAVRVIEVDPHRLDPRGERLDAARRLILHDHRARGLEDILDASVLLAGSQFLRHDGDIVVAAMIPMWQKMDDGDFEAADAHLRAASERLADPGSWPILQLMRAHLAVHRRATEEVQTYVSAFEHATLATVGPFAQQPHSQIQRLADHLSRHAGRPVPSPGFLPVTPSPGTPFYPRTEFTVHLMEALYAVREGRLPEVRAALGRAVALSPRREIGLYTLAHATQEEVKALRQVAEDVPGAERLHLERALRIAGALDTPTLEISQREREVLGLLRRGATNPEMAEAMFVSVNTVKFHRANLMRKLEASSRDELLAAAAVRGL